MGQIYKGGITKMKNTTFERKVSIGKDTVDEDKIWDMGFTVQDGYAVTEATMQEPETLDEALNETDEEEALQYIIAGIRKREGDKAVSYMKSRISNTVSSEVKKAIAGLEIFGVAEDSIPQEIKFLPLDEFKAWVQKNLL
jgi:hypothetical protein